MLPAFSERTSRTSAYNRFIGVLIKAELDKRSITHNNNRGMPIAVFGNDNIGTHINIDGVYEYEYIEDLLQLLSVLKIDTHKSTAIDIGANIGNHAIQFSSYFQNVICFEPNPRAFSLLTVNTEKINNVEIHNFGCSNKNMRINLYENYNNIGASSVSHSNSWDRPVEIIVKPLDEIVEKLTNVNLIKIDVEGMEMLTLKGAEKIISRLKPVICLEQNEAEFRSEFKETEALDFLRDKGYEIFALETQQKKNIIFRRLKNILQLFTGISENRRIIQYARLPKSSYPMVFAIHSSRIR